MSPTYCPINGAYSFTYSSSSSSSSNGEEKKCEAHTSEIADCPYGFGLDLKFKGCSFGSMGKIFDFLKSGSTRFPRKKILKVTFEFIFYTDMSLHCLGDWEGPDGQRFVALMDTRAQARARTARSGILGITGQQQQEPESLDRPRYRCAVS